MNYEYKTELKEANSNFTPPSSEWELSHIGPSTTDGKCTVVWRRLIVNESNQTKLLLG